MKPYIQQIIMFGGNFTPIGWTYCDGELSESETNQLPSHIHVATGTNTEATLASLDTAKTNEPTIDVLTKSNYIIDRSNTAPINTYRAPNNLVQVTPNTDNNLYINIIITNPGTGVNNVQPSIAINYITPLNKINPSKK